AGVVSSKVKLTRPCWLTSISLIMPRLTTSRPRSGSLIVASASSTCCELGPLISNRMLPRLLTSMRHEGGWARAGRTSNRDGGQVWPVAEGAAMEKKETVLRVRAPYSRFGVYETALLGMLSSCSGWATAAREIVEAAGGKRVISFGARHVHPLIAPTMEYSA